MNTDQIKEKRDIIRRIQTETEVACPRIDDPEVIRESYADYIPDESRLEHSYATTRYSPTSTEEVSAAVREVAAKGEKLVVSGARTGIVWGAMVSGPHNLVSLEKLRTKPSLRFDEHDGHWCARMGAGTMRAELNTALDKGSFTS